MEPNDVKISLIIKAANQKYDDIRIDCNLSWSVLDLKTHLSTNYPSKPKINDQRIIYSGHLLNDDQLIKNIIDLSSSGSSGDNQNTFIFHLVCPQKSTPNPKPGNNTQNKTSTTNSNGSNSTTIPTAIPSEANVSPTSTPLNSVTWTNNQMMQPDNMLMQQSYQTLMNQYYQYMSYYFLTCPPMDFASYAAFTNAYVQSFNGNVFVDNNQQAMPVESNINSSNNNQANNENQNNQAGNNLPARAVAPIEDHELLAGDWTEWIYSISKAIVILSIIYFYTSPNRLVTLISIILIIYFYKNMFNNFGANDGAGERRRVNRQDNARRNNQNNNNQQNEANQGDQVDGDSENNNNQNPDSNEPNNNNDVVQDDNNSNRYSGIRFVWVFITSLFTSLIPDPAPINYQQQNINARI